MSAVAAQYERFSRWRPQPDPVDAGALAGASEYDCTVAELASRGFTLGALLEFLCMLLEGEAMPSFDPDASTTFQVTYEAVVPLSAGGPFSRVMTCGTRCYPECFITHTWSNLFCHTVAAVVADALRVPFFSHLLHRLRTLRQVRALMDQLGSTPRVGTRCGRPSGNALYKTYWLCCVSIDQHTVACTTKRLCDAGHVLERVPVDATHAPCTSAGCQEPASDGRRFQCRLCGDSLCQGCASLARRVCSCSKPKLAAGTALCEVDKFDEMMAHLRRVHGGIFYHVVALDRTGEALGRTWVVAEIAQGQRAKLRQDIKVLFPLSLAACDLAARVLQIDVMACRSTNPADTEMILAKIEDKDAFNERLRRTLMSSIRPRRATLACLVVLPIPAIAINLWGNMEALRRFRRDGLLTLINFAGSSLVVSYTTLLAASHLKYGAIVDAVCASRGFRMTVLLDLLESSGLHRRPRFSPLWALQKWYARQIVLQDSPDEDADAAPLRGQVPMLRTSLRSACFDMLVLLMLRLVILFLLGDLIVFAACTASVDFTFYHVTTSVWLGAPVALFFSDPGVRGRTWQGLALFVVILARVAYGMAFFFYNDQEEESCGATNGSEMFPILILLLGCCSWRRCGNTQSPRALSSEQQPHAAMVGRPIAAQTQ